MGHFKKINFNNVSNAYIEGALTQILSTINEPDLKDISEDNKYAYLCGWQRQTIDYINVRLNSLLNKIKGE